jgi:hypothetical protein
MLLDLAHHAERDFFHIGLDKQLQNNSGSVLKREDKPYLDSNVSAHLLHFFIEAP